MLPQASDYTSLRQSFQWHIPDCYNIGVDVCDKWADGSGRLALIHLKHDGSVQDYSFDDLKAQSNQLANVLTQHGLSRGDRVGVLLPQAPETALAHIATHKLGGISVPLFSLFQEEALTYRLGNCEARALITDREGLEKVKSFQAQLPELQVILCIDGAGGEDLALDFHKEVSKASINFTPVNTAADDPAILIYTSGTTGQPKGALHAHRVLLGHLPGVEMPQELFPQADDLFWTPADWAWIGGLIDVLLPSLHHGVPVLAHRFAKFDPEEAFRIMADFKVRNVFMPPTALKMMRNVNRPQDRWDFKLRSIGSGGETLGAELLDWGRETFGITINEFYGQTECNLVLSNCAGLMPVHPGSMGRPVPGHGVAIVNEAGEEQPAGTPGNIAVKRPDPVMFLQYWNNPKATEEKFVGDWLLTGDQGWQDKDGYFHFIGRNDDVITSAGYRIGPGEIEDCLLKHPAVQLAAAVGIPDPLRTERVKAFIVLKPGIYPEEALASEIQTFVKRQLAAHEYPREVEFIADMPMTTTGKIIRKALRSR